MVIIPGKQKNLAVRFYANAIDYTVYFIFFGIYTFTMGTEENGVYRVQGFPALTYIVFWVVYFPACESLTGQTLGKKAFDLYIVNLSGQAPSFGQAFIRRLLDVFEMSTFGVMAILTINYSQKNQRVGDMMADTTVVRTKTTCKVCGSYLELSLKETIEGTFVCPTCNNVN